MATLRIQSILYLNEPASIRRALSGICQAASASNAAGLYSRVEVAYGDCSPQPIFDSSVLPLLEADLGPHAQLIYRHFGANLGSAAGHNALLADASTDHVLIMNPDVGLAYSTLLELAVPLSDGSVGMVEARQLPVEHPKAYNPITGDTGWATTACALIPRDVFDRVGLFDNETFFLYCDDVDFSWRVRLEGLRVIYRPTAGVFHDKRLADDGAWQPSAAERYYSAEAALLLPTKWSRPDVATRILRSYQASTLEHLQKAAAEFLRRREAGLLPQPLDPQNRVSEFIGDMYAHHRFGI